jgi:hypothetical protein
VGQDEDAQTLVPPGLDAAVMSTKVFVLVSVPRLACWSIACRSSPPMWFVLNCDAITSLAPALGLGDR